MGMGPPSLPFHWPLQIALPAAAAVAVLVCLCVRAIIPVLQRRQILDRPNARSSHTVPTPRGGGIGVVAVLLPALAVWAVLTDVALATAIPVLGGAALLALVSWADDLRGLGPLPRLGAQALATGAALVPAFLLAVAIQPLLGLALLVLFFAWIWFVNLFNFMDGIDGITGVETLVCAVGVAIVALSLPAADALFAPAALIAGAAIGFLVWNWHPARVFLGDVGSVPLGFLVGWLLLELAARGAWAAAIILPSYYGTDATLTLLRRLLRGEKIWQAHKEHFYQRAVQAGRSHSQVSGAVGLAGTVLIALAWWTTRGYEWEGIAGAALVVVLLMAWMSPRRIEPAEMDG